MSGSSLLAMERSSQQAQQQGRRTAPSSAEVRIQIDGCSRASSSNQNRSSDGTEVAVDGIWSRGADISQPPKKSINVFPKKRGEWLRSSCSEFFCMLVAVVVIFFTFFLGCTCQSISYDLHPGSVAHSKIPIISWQKPRTWGAWSRRSRIWSTTSIRANCRPSVSTFVFSYSLGPCFNPYGPFCYEGRHCSTEQMEAIRDQQEKLARLHFELGAQHDVTPRTSEHMNQLVSALEHLSQTIEQLHPDATQCRNDSNEESWSCSPIVTNAIID